MEVFGQCLMYSINFRHDSLFMTTTMLYSVGQSCGVARGRLGHIYCFVFMMRQTIEYKLSVGADGVWIILGSTRLRRKVSVSDANPYASPATLNVMGVLCACKPEDLAVKINCVNKLSNQIQKVDSVYVSTHSPLRGSLGPVFFFLK